MGTLRDAIIVRKYTHANEVVQAFFDLPANTSVTVTYTPPSGYALFVVFGTSGPQTYGTCTNITYADGTQIWGLIIASEVLQHPNEMPSMPIIKSKFEAIMTNNDTVTHTIDAAFFGFLIPLSEVDNFLKEMRGEDIKEKMDAQIKLLEDIRDWLIKTLKR